MKIPWTLVLLLAAISLRAEWRNNTSINDNFSTSTTISNNYSEDLLRERLEFISDDFDFRYNAEVHDIIIEYTTYGIRQTENLMGRTPVYFPIIEYYLKKNNLPESLKYLPIVESSLRPEALSSVGAAGLWQFMEGTARELGLKINSNVDERRDPIRSTEAAMAYLGTLHNKYNDWNLVLAAYNCGPGNVNKAIKKAGGERDFWKIRKFLPSQTQKYIPAMIAAGYISNYYQDHGIQPNYSQYGVSSVRSIQLYEGVSFKEISDMTGVSNKTLRKLNPSYKNAFIPQNKTGNYLILPVSAMEIFNNLGYAHAAYRKTIIPKNSFKSVYQVKSGDTIASLSKLFECSVSEIKDWNHLVIPEVQAGQEIKIYFSNEILAQKN